MPFNWPPVVHSCTEVAATPAAIRITPSTVFASTSLLAIRTQGPPPSPEAPSSGSSAAKYLPSQKLATVVDVARNFSLPWLAELLWPKTKATIVLGVIAGRAISHLPG